MGFIPLFELLNRPLIVFLNILWKVLNSFFINQFHEVSLDSGLSWRCDFGDGFHAIPLPHPARNRNLLGTQVRCREFSQASLHRETCARLIRT